MRVVLDEKRVVERVMAASALESRYDGRTLLTADDERAVARVAMPQMHAVAAALGAWVESFAIDDASGLVTLEMTPLAGSGDDVAAAKLLVTLLEEAAATLVLAQTAATPAAAALHESRHRAALAATCALFEGANAPTTLAVRPFYL